MKFVPEKLCALALAGLFMAGTICGCSGNKQLQDIPGEPAVYYFIVGNTFVGKYEDRQFISYNNADGSTNFDMEISELLEQQEFRTYLDGGIMRQQSVMAFRVDDNDGGFDQDYHDILSKYGDPHPQDENIITFHLPVELGDEVEGIKLPATGFQIGMPTLFETLPFAVNSQRDPRPREIQQTQAQETDTAQLQQLVQEGGVSNAAYGDILCYAGDFDDDGKEERLCVSNSAQDHAQVDGVYALAWLTDHNGKVSVVYSNIQTQPDAVCNVSYIGAYDMDFEGSYELALVCTEGQTVRTIVQSMQSGEYVTVLQGLH